jgi:hypothetical protein
MESMIRWARLIKADLVWIREETRRQVGEE